MAILSVDEDFNGRSSTITRSGETHKRVFQVRTTDHREGPRNVVLAPGIPRIDDGHPEGGPARASRVGPALLKDGADAAVFLVPVDYDEEIPETGAGGERNDFPTLQFSRQQRQKPYTVDANNNPVVNSAGQPFNPLPVRDESYLQMTINARVAFDIYTPTLTETFDDHVNSAVFFGFPKGKVKQITTGATTIRTQRSSVIEAQWDLRLLYHIDTDWLDKEIDRGRFTLENGPAFKIEPTFSLGASTIQVGTVAKRILDKRGIPTEVDLLLDGKGGKLVSGAAIQLAFHPYPVADLNKLLTTFGLPTGLPGYKVLIER